LKYGGEAMKILTVPAKLNELDHVLDFINTELEVNDCPMKVQVQIVIAVEEIFVNIAHYAYPSREGDAIIGCQFQEEPRAVEISFVDRGVPYNPLEKNDPDVTLGVEDRQIGGLGIFMVKKSMDEVTYNYVNDKNILIIKKLL
jgi:anti-sigma regulatory factor (Ser/Thr protein kinase)